MVEQIFFKAMTDDENSTGPDKNTITNLVRKARIAMVKFAKANQARADEAV